ncbi:MAG: hypothetical protein WB507_06020 [Solirubrobacterales bacterium]
MKPSVGSTHTRTRIHRLRPRIIALFALTASLFLGVVFARAEGTPNGNLQVALTGRLSPRTLPRSLPAPISVSVSGQISTADGAPPPQLKLLTIEINRHGRLDYTGLPLCPLSKIKLASTQLARSSCRSALVGKGTFSSNIVIKGEPPYPSTGQLLVFNGREGGHQVLYGHIYDLQPFPTSFVLTFEIKSLAHGPYGTALIAHVARTLGNWGYVTGISMTLSRRFSYRGASHSYLSSACPAPQGFPQVTFPLARAGFGFAQQKLSATLTRTCRVRG